MKNDNLLIKERIKQFKEHLCEEFRQKKNLSALSRRLVSFIDQILIFLFTSNKLDQGNHWCLVALGSYGRRELLLHSDIDLLLLHSESINKTQLNQAQKFIRDCWDVGLAISHQITNVHSCADLAENELSVISSIMDSHPICGSITLLEELNYKTHRLHMWPSHEFFFAKLQEQKTRDRKYGDSEYNLEPNIKYGPGGLRDLQILLSISKRHFNVKKLADGITHGFITNKEYEELIHGQRFLWKVRFALHMLAEKAEERLSFDYQIKLAQVFGYENKPHSLAIEQFMKDYFKIIKRNRELSEMLLQWFDETIIHHQKQKLIPLDNEFQLSNQYIEVRYPQVFIQNPSSLFRLFLWIAKKPSITGVRASTVRLIRESLYVMGSFKKNKETTILFMDILKAPHNPYDALQRMNRYGVLAQYLDCFATVTGQMQYDLFHVYTVDQHTLFVIRNISRFKQVLYEKQFPLCAEIMHTLEKQEILYLSALFHDIAKGRGGDHSELGAIEAQKFSERHPIEPEDAKLLVWLVHNHLLMSQTAQRQDIYDPKTIERFCQLLPEPKYLDYLYLLTVADICATNPALWNAWKDSLLKELYKAAKHLFQEKELLDETALIKKRKKSALKLLTSEQIGSDDLSLVGGKGMEEEGKIQPALGAIESVTSERSEPRPLGSGAFKIPLPNGRGSDSWSPFQLQLQALDKKSIHNLWDQFKDKYFLHEPPQVIARHTKAILEAEEFPLVLIMPHHSEGGTEVFIYMPHRDERFTITTSVLSNHQTTIQEASIMTCSNQFDLDTYIILDQKNQAFLDSAKAKVIQKELCFYLKKQGPLPSIINKRLPRALAHFNINTQITYTDNKTINQTGLFLVSNDRPGLLATVSRVFLNLAIHLHNAKIVTAGERAEDMFYISNQEGQILSTEEKELLSKELIRSLSLSF